MKPLVFLVFLFLCPFSLAEVSFFRSFDADLSKYCKSDELICRNEKAESAHLQALELKIITACQEYVRVNQCRKVKDSLPQEERDTIIKCTLDDLCKSQRKISRFECTIEGVKAQFNLFNSATVVASGLATGMITGSIILESSLVLAPILLYGASEKEKACDKDIKFKRMAVQMHNVSLYENEKALDPDGKDSALLKLPCSELQKFLHKRLDILAQKRIEAQRWSLNYKQPKQSAAALALKSAFESNRCFDPAVVEERACRAVSGFLTNYAAGLGVGIATIKGTAGVAAQAAKSQDAVPTNSVAEAPKPPALNATAEKTIEDFKQLKKVDVEPDGVNKHTFPLRKVKKVLSASNPPYQKVRKLKSEMAWAEKRLTEIERTLKERYSSGSQFTNDDMENYLKLAVEKEDLIRFTSKVKSELPYWEAKAAERPHAKIQGNESKLSEVARMEKRLAEVERELEAGKNTQMNLYSDEGREWAKLQSERAELLRQIPIVLKSEAYRNEKRLAQGAYQQSPASVLGEREFKLKSDHIDSLKEATGAGSAVYSETKPGSGMEGSFHPHSNRITIYQNTENAAETYLHELSHARTEFWRGYDQGPGPLLTNPFEFKITLNRGKPVDESDYLGFQHGSEASAYRAGARASVVTGKPNLAIDGYKYSTDMAERNIQALTQAQEQVRSLIRKGQTEIKSGLTMDDIDFQVKLNDGHTHTIWIQRPPEKLAGEYPDAKKIDQYLGFLIKAQRQVIKKNNQDLKRLGASP